VNPLRSLQAKLIGAFAGITLVALALAAALFVANRQDEEKSRELDRVAAASGAITVQFSLAEIHDRGDLARFVREAAHQFGWRVLLFDRLGNVAADSGDGLTGQRIAMPARRIIASGRGYVSWSPASGSPGSGLTLVTAPGTEDTAPGRTEPGGPGTYSVALGVSQDAISGAWVDLLPGLAAAAAIALAASVVLAVVVARYITRPLARLTVAAGEVSAGRFDVDIDTGRQDEIGRLGRAFADMAGRVGRARAEMRALVADVSHDLKTPLTSVLGFSRALATGVTSSPAEAQRMGAIIHEEATRLSTRLDDLLYLSEIDSGHAELVLSTVAPGALLHAVVDRVLGGEQLAGRELTIDVQETPAVVADAARLERALENLLVNARMYTPEGGSIAVMCRAAAAPYAAELGVSNSAPGLSKDEAPRIFERFYRGERSRGQGSGSGLGLPIAADIVALHGGKLTAQVEYGMLVVRVLLRARPGSGQAG
jgi:signal transduction histidine kinase